MGRPKTCIPCTWFAPWIRTVSHFMTYRACHVISASLYMWSVLLVGGLSLLWVCAWFYITADTPDQHPRITEAERKYITSSIEYNTNIRVLPRFIQVIYSSHWYQVHYNNCMKNLNSKENHLNKKKRRDNFQKASVRM